MLIGLLDMVLYLGKVKSIATKSNVEVLFGDMAQGDF